VPDPGPDKARISRRFGRSATTYDRHAVIQRQMAERLVDALPAASPRPAAIIEIGCGTGYLTQLLCARFPQASVTAVDLSEQMIDVARARLGGAAELLVGDAEERPWGARTFDLVVSSATLQWLAAPAQTLGLLADSLRPGGTTVHATFGPQTFGELHRVFREVELDFGLAPGRHGLELRGASEWAALLEAQGLESVRCESTVTRVEYPDCRTFLGAVKGTGSNTGSANGAPRLPRAALLEVLRRYDRTELGPGGVRVTYELLELSARRPRYEPFPIHSSPPS
jgi:malonyl-CoA O-methyltransferase